MPAETTLQRFSPIVLRLGLTALFLWFGISQLIAPNDWVAWVPQWVPDFTHMDAKMIVLLNGGFEVIFGILMLLGFFVRWAALILGLHLLSIAFELGYGDIAARDVALAICCFALALYGNDDWALQRKFS